MAAGHAQAPLGLTVSRFYRLIEILSLAFSALLLIHIAAGRLNFFFSNFCPFLLVLFIVVLMERLLIHRREWVGCSSKNFLRPGQFLINVSRLLPDAWEAYHVRQHIPHPMD